MRLFARDLVHSPSGQVSELLPHLVVVCWETAVTNVAAEVFAKASVGGAIVCAQASRPPAPACSDWVAGDKGQEAGGQSSVLRSARQSVTANVAPERAPVMFSRPVVLVSPRSTFTKAF
jgi:hypothetical protein